MVNMLLTSVRGSAEGKVYLYNAMIVFKLHNFHYILYNIQIHISLLLGNMYLARIVTNNNNDNNNNNIF